MEHVRHTVKQLAVGVSVPGRKLETLAVSSQLKTVATTLVSIQVMLFANAEIS